MIVKRISPIDGEEREMEIPITQEQLDSWVDGLHITVACPILTEDEKDFILTGASATEWIAEFNKHRKE